MMLVSVFDKVVSWLQRANPPSFHFLQVSGSGLLMIYLIIIGIAMFLMKKQKPALFLALAAANLLLMFLGKEEWQRLRQNRVVVYNTGKANHAERIIGDKYVTLNTDTGSNKNNYTENNAHIGWQAWRKDSTVAYEIMEVGDKTVLMLNEPVGAGNHFPVDYLIINFTGQADPVELQKIFSPSLLVIGDNYTHMQQLQFVSNCKTAGIPVHSINKDGAFIVSAGQ
jgi:competence protein ComEC